MHCQYCALAKLLSGLVDMMCRPCWRRRYRNKRAK